MVPPEPSPPSVECPSPLGEEEASRLAESDDPLLNASGAVMAAIDNPLVVLLIAGVYQTPPGNATLPRLVSKRKQVPETLLAAFDFAVETRRNSGSVASKALRQQAIDAIAVQDAWWGGMRAIGRQLDIQEAATQWEAHHNALLEWRAGEFVEQRAQWDEHLLAAHETQWKEAYAAKRRLAGAREETDEEDGSGGEMEGIEVEDGGEEMEGVEEENGGEEMEGVEEEDGADGGEKVDERGVGGEL